MKREHATAAPSSADRHVPCPGSVLLEAASPEPPPTEESIEGDHAHTVAMHFAEEGVMHDVVAEGYVVTPEMKRGAVLYGERCNANRPDMRYFETPVYARRVHSECWGTPDYQEYRAQSRTLRTVDYKFGHLYVEVYGLFQLIAYASGALTMLGLDIEEVEKFEFEIVQPRWYGKEGKVRTWTITRAEFLVWEEKLRAAYVLAFGPDPKAHVGSQCLFCRARANCVTLQHAASNVMQYSSSADLMLSTPEQIGSELTLINSALTLLKARATGLTQQAESLLRKGNRVPGFHLEAKAGRRKWNDTLDKQELITMGEMLGLNLGKTVEIVTPAQAEDLGVPEELLNKFSKRDSALVLEATNPVQLKKAFGVNK